jgi:rod shape-determining protein MreC
MTPRSLSRLRDPLIIGVLLLAPLALYLTSWHRGREPNLLDRSLLALASPLQRGLDDLFELTGQGVGGYVALRGAHEEALACRQSLAEARGELNELKEQRAENQRLKAMLAYTDATADQEVTARIIGLNPSPLFQSVRLDKGEEAGVRVGMPVVTPEGVVGQVVRAVSGSSDVMLLTDPASRIGVVLQRSRVRGTAVGTGDGRRLSLNLVRREDDVRDGDVVVTAGSDGIFPRGLQVGALGDVARPAVGMFLSAKVVPSVDLHRVEEVLVIPQLLSVSFAPAEPGGLR